MPGYEPVTAAFLARRRPYLDTFAVATLPYVGGVHDFRNSRPCGSGTFMNQTRPRHTERPARLTFSITWPFHIATRCLGIENPRTKTHWFSVPRAPSDILTVADALRCQSNLGLMLLSMAPKLRSRLKSMLPLRLDADARAHAEVLSQPVTTKSLSFGLLDGQNPTRTAKVYQASACSWTCLRKPSLERRSSRVAPLGSTRTAPTRERKLSLTLLPATAGTVLFGFSPRARIQT
ncbi:hypothetical protein HMN09_01328600 [Mycena chlorophos]|uniref:Uncharacterized protein n=1 Tax=Mycena chlorophos TaxID=658473 RepID=A0A8H6S1M8_MYCCL|nr:hypothetical protein HMN09_01328600 [Mycena chlorophos]